MKWLKQDWQAQSVPKKLTRTPQRLSGTNIFHEP